MLPDPRRAVDWVEGQFKRFPHTGHLTPQLKSGGDAESKAV